MDRFVSKQEKERQAGWRERRGDWGDKKTKRTVLPKTNGLHFKLEEQEVSFGNGKTFLSMQEVYSFSN